MSSPDLKQATARTLKWNVIDRVASQVLYAITGIVLARVLTPEEFGLVGAVLVFQAFASLLVDSGFSYALIQRKAPDRLDYSSVLWFNLAVAVVLYGVLWLCAPLVADCFGGDPRLIPLSRVMFLTFILNASAIVQTNRLMKRMDVKMIAVSNTIGLIVSGAVGIVMALTGWGAWAIVWQTIVLAATKSLLLWLTSRWRPLMQFSWTRLKSFVGVGSGMMLTSFLNTLFQNIYAFVIGNRVGLGSLGYYTQSDKWSKMGISSISQVLTSSFLPVLSAVQDEPERLQRVTSKMNRFTAYLSLPALGFLIVMAAPVFHLLFGTKWDPSIILFQLLLLRGVFTVVTSLFSNYIVAMGRSRIVVGMETLRDVVALGALAATWPFMAVTTPTNPVWGLEILLWGQIAASAVTTIATAYYAIRVTGGSMRRYMADFMPYLAIVLAVMAVLWAELALPLPPLAMLAVQGITGLGLYMGVCAALRSVIQREALTYLLGRFRKKRT